MTSAYEMVVGLEVHVQLATKTKLFCACPTGGFGEPPNSRICPVCTGQPGTLPVLNEAAVDLAFQAALALGGRLAPFSTFARKNYFYPDLPKAYQISQYERPFCDGGWLDIRTQTGEKRVRIRRIHLEEDAGKLLHAIGSRELDHSLVDFNRGGVPLIEIVSEADIRGADEAAAYLTALKEILQYAGVSRCDMEKGELRCDANVSLRRSGSQELGTRAEIKNLNSVRAVKEALEHESLRQAGLLDAGEFVVQETRLWDARRGETVAMRSKEEAHDYRYFPDPDLLPLAAAGRRVEELRACLPELPAARRARFMSDYELSAYDAGILTAQRALADYFEAAARGQDRSAAKAAANLIATELLARLNAEDLRAADIRLAPKELGALSALVVQGKLSSKGAKAAFCALWESGGSTAEVVERLGLAQVSDEARVRVWVQEALAANPRAVADYRSGEERALGAIVGAVMKLSRGKANPSVVNRLIMESISSSS
ncbi:MAG TPA: Asp-tRNA(Asn)/Glu-tRNA(Gln) amidotransferase GatCAB subunit B [Elusimicrobia bacterium]|nr:Asp-tRNA(Asn)/Glu-tRNA(Gln) amidotransferase GatCAB subunit B [Elusimicrobiota bacterium]HBT62085.1 Asp-tRNA(Asn)/Glu-tRNA(Gln) amidotransferase GatCAB subunit B [Elusimicrobiota bacterium]